MTASARRTGHPVDPAFVRTRMTRPAHQRGTTMPTTSTPTSTPRSPTRGPEQASKTPTQARRHRLRRDERGEGVISAAIAVLIMAFIGVGMWVAFNTTFQHTAKNVDNEVNCIGQTSC
jgi:hypothetical protein